MSLLKRINSPTDLKQLKRADLPILAAEIRNVIIEVVSKNGGHLAPSLGVVELAIAIHYVFDAPNDKIIWDVGHQSYAHKILTGRREAFRTLRQRDGISGFTRMSESNYDAFSTGHSSTSISAGLGIACAKRLKNDKTKVIAVIGDGSMTAGLAYEGLNQAGDINKNIIDRGVVNFEERWWETVEFVNRALDKLTKKRSNGYGAKDANELPFVPMIPIIASMLKEIEARDNKADCYKKMDIW